MRTVVSLFLLSVFVVAPCNHPTCGAQDKWPEQKAKRFGKPISDEHRSAIADAAPESPTAKPKKTRRALIFYRCGGFIHNSIPFGNAAMEEVAKRTDAFEVDLADEYSVFTSQNLKQYDCIILNNTTNMIFPEASQLNAFMDFIAGGKGLVGIHAASDNFGRHPEARAIVGGEFGGHPWGAGGTWAFKLNDPDHVLNKAFGGNGFWHKDEIYQYKPATYVGTDVLRVLVSLDMSKSEVSDRIKDAPREVPVSWVRTAGDGRVFYTNFGHNADTFKDPVMLRHMLDGIQYAMGDLEVDDMPTSKIDVSEPVLAPEKP
jgi:type 1 glutamine amidotransferase